MPVYQNSCKRCVWYLLARSCMAYPDGIPEDIWTGKDAHVQSREGDNGITFEPIEDEEEDEEK